MLEGVGWPLLQLRHDTEVLADHGDEPAIARVDREAQCLLVRRHCTSQFATLLRNRPKTIEGMGAARGVCDVVGDGETFRVELQRARVLATVPQHRALPAKDVRQRFGRALRHEKLERAIAHLERIVRGDAAPVVQGLARHGSRLVDNGLPPPAALQWSHARQ